VTRDGWINSFAIAVGTDAPSPDDIELLLELAGVAAHASERTAGRSPADSQRRDRDHGGHCPAPSGCGTGFERPPDQRGALAHAEQPLAGAGRGWSIAPA
jgi:hypothetical protein